MAEPSIILRSAVAGKAPTTTTLDFGQLAINTSDGIIYYKSQDSAGGTEIINQLGGADSGFANNSLITLSPGSGLLSGGSFTINQSNNEVISFKIDSSVIPTLVGNNTFSGTNTFSTLSNQAAELTAVMIDGSGTLGTRELDASAFTNTAITTNVTEGTNLYYTGSRANTAIDTRVTQSFVNNLNVDAITLGGNDSSYYLDYNNFANIPDSAGALIEDTTVTLAAGAGLLSGGSFTTNQSTPSTITFKVDSSSIPTLVGGLLDSAAIPSLDIGTDTHGILPLSRTTGTIDSSQIPTLVLSTDVIGTIDSSQIPSIDINNDTHSILDSDRLPPLPSLANDATITLSAGNGLITGGSFTTDQAGNVTITHALGTPSTLTGSTTNAVTPTSHTHEIDETGFSIAASQLTGTLDSAAIPSLSISTDTHGSLALSRTTGILDSAQIASFDIATDTHGILSLARTSGTLDSSQIPVLSLSSDIDGTTTDLPEGTNLYFTNARSRSAISVTDAGGEGSLAYNSGTGVITYTGPSPANDATITLSAGNGLITGGSFTTDQSGNATITHTLGTPTTLTSATTNTVTATSHTHEIDESGFSIAATQLTGTIDSARLPTLVLSADINGTTTDLTEGTNLYYTVTRANSAIDTRVNKAFVDALNVDADTLDGQNGTYYLDYGNFTNTPDSAGAVVNDTTITIAGGNGIITGGDFTTNQLTPETITLNIDSSAVATLTSGLIDSSQIPVLKLGTDVTGTTDNITEGTNQFFTTARARSSITVNDTGGEGSLAYDSGTGVMTYTGPLPSVGAYPLIETAVGITMEQANHYHVSDSAQTMTLPLADSADRLELSVRGFTNTTVARNGNKIMGIAEDITLNVPYSSLTFEFIDSDYGWFVSDTRGDVTVVNSYDGSFDSAQFPSIDINNDTHSILDSDRLPPLPSPANDATITLTAGNGLITGGSFTTDQAGNVTITHTLGTPSTLTSTTTNAVTAASHTHLIDESGFSIAPSQLTGDVALGTGTSGSYVQQGATSGSGISGSVNSESGTFTVTSNATNLNTASTTVFRDASGNFSAGTITAALTGNASTATTAAAWTTGRTISLTGDVTGTSAAWTGSGNISFTTAVGNDTHTHNANNLTGTTLAAGVTASSLTSVGTLTNLDVDNVNVNGSTVTYNSIAATTAATNTLATITETSIASFTAATYGGGKFVITAKDGVNRHICELLVTHDGTTAIATQYGSISTAGDLATYDVDINTGSVRILATSASTASTVYNVSETLLVA